ncbi:hypothetical protein AAHK14_01170 [Moraxella sp. K1664]|nr:MULTISPECIES: hypothetical protein [Moraxella]MBE9579539.1 hypothetical protein [Moraxella sp. K1664]MBE9597124.1 hypothetical protein [Moraxella sp. K2450]
MWYQNPRSRQDKGLMYYLWDVAGLDRRLIFPPNLSRSVRFGQGGRPVGF